MKDKSKLDQHFLKDKKTLKKILDISKLSSRDIVLEIGSGKGILTLELSKKTKKVIVVELDKDLKKYLDKSPKNVDIKYGNILKIINSLKFNKIISNIPYSITEPLFKKLLKLDFDISVLLIGKKFYDLIFNEESKWSIIIPIFFNVEKIMDVPKESFEPKPRTNSVLIKLKIRKKLNKKERLIREFVLQDDKKVKNALIYSLKRINKLTKRQAKEKINIPLDLLEKNVDNLSNKQFKIIYDKLK